MKKGDLQYRPRVKTEKEFYQFNIEGSEMVNKRYNELIETRTNLYSILIKYYPSTKNPSLFVLIWEEYVRDK
jgi:hypothetical protein